MSNETTPKSLVLIVGAGASKEVNLPIGSELISQISASLNIRFNHGVKAKSGADDIYEAYLLLAQQTKLSPAHTSNINPYLQASRRISEGVQAAISIDNFIHSHRNDETIALCGKLAIASCILKAESNSALRVNSNNTYNTININGINATWFDAFFKRLTEYCDISELPERLSKISIVSFNYDRCIEHYLYHMLQIYYGIDKEKSATILQSLNIYHPYGIVGKLPWQSQSDGIAFGSSPSTQQLISLTKQIKTFTEGIDESKSDLLSIRETVANAQRIAFLGFAFHPLNLKLLFSNAKYSSFDSHQNSIYATAHGISISDIQHIKNELVRVAGFQESSIHLRSDLVCSQIFYEYSRGLALS
jgi:hypothetical protein